MKKLNLTVVAPAYNEFDNLQLFCKKTFSVVSKITPQFEVIIIDDGSTDESWTLLKKLKHKYSKLKAIRFRRQSGQTACLMAGFSRARGKIIVTIDADLQQNPADISRLINALDQKTDVVSGYRNLRSRSFANRFISRVEYFFVRLLLGTDVKDSGVSPNAYRRQILQDINLFGEMHRYLVPILIWRGFKVKTIPVTIHKRHAGKSKYKTTKAIKGFLDLLIVKFWQDYSTRPIHIFGTIGLLFIGIGTIFGTIEAVRKLVFNISIFNSTIPLLAVFLAIVGIQFLILGILADIMIRTYYKDKSEHRIRSIIE